MRAYFDNFLVEYPKKKAAEGRERECVPARERLQENEMPVEYIRFFFLIFSRGGSLPLPPPSPS